MALYSFITKQCNSDIQKHGLVDSVTKYAAKIEYDQSVGSVDLYPHPFLKRNVRRHYRLIIEERQVGEDIVYCFLSVFQRSDSEYAQFMSMNKQGQLHLFSKKYAPGQNEIRSYLAERKSQNRVEPLPTLSPVEHTYLMGLTNAPDGTEQSIVESRTWVERITHNVKPGLRTEYFELIQNLLWEGEIDPAQTVIGKGKYWILYRYFPKSEKLFIVGPLEPKVKEKDENHLRERYNRIFQANDHVADQVIREEGLRSYPSIVTADKELWLDIQNSKDANLSLSPEEMDVLNSVLSPSVGSANNSDQEAMYPLFINGRPGSGKSTILLYLFAEHLHFHLKQIWTHKTTRGIAILERPPIYLTYSESLLNDARRIVSDILRCDSEKSQSQYELTDIEIKETIENSFGHFREFLRSALPIADRLRFDPRSFVDFPHFRRLFLEKTSQDVNPKLRDLSPEIAWHVIRTYIKGMRQHVHGYLDIDAYENELPRKQQTVTHPTFELVYTEIWEKFYKAYCESEGHWDDQDLARKLLDLSEEGRIELSQFPAVFCDESQDFTKIELEVVFQLSRFTKRNIKINELHSVLPRIPFAFAGDPFQTLNPTGFDWDATKAFFHNSIVRPLDPASRANLTFNYKELEFNYRSAQPIVQFCNLIQLMRGRAFNIKDIKPQKTWQIRPALDPVYYDIAQVGCQQAMQTQQALIYIVPCQEGEEEAYVKKDPFLKRIAWNEEEQVVTRDVLSPIRAKGLQFQRIVLYKFGEHAIDTYQEQVNLLLDPFIDRTGNGESLPKEDTLPLEYFVNHLYVAASRPRHQLIIVDTKKALDNFWAFAIEGDQQALIYSYNSNQDWNREHITRLTQGSRESWYQIKDDALTLGRDFFGKGKELRDPYFMDRARQNYLAAGDRQQADQALALKLFYEGQLKEAGLVYVKLNQPGEAIACFWRSQNYSDIVDLKSNFKSNNPKHHLLFDVAEYMESDRSLEASVQCIEHIYDAIGSQEIKRSVVTDALWMSIIQEAVQQLALKIDEKGGAEKTAKEWKKVWLQLTGILDAGITLSDTISLARIACVAEEYTQCRELLVKNNISPTNTTEWTTLAFAESSEYPEKIRWLARLNLHSRVIDSYESSISGSSQSPALSNRDSTLVFSAYMHSKKYEALQSFLAQYPNEKRYLSLLSKLLQEERYELANQVVLKIIHFYVFTAKWNAALHFVMSLPELPENISPQNNQLKLDPARGHAFLIQQLARSEALQRESSPSQRHAVSTYLKLQLVNPSQSLQANLRLQEAGSAFERAGVFEDILNFYDSIIKHAPDKQSSFAQWAKLRWVKTKFREASSIKADASRNEAINNATSNLKEWGLTKNKIQTAPRFPKLEPLKEITLPVEEVLLEKEFEIAIPPEINQAQSVPETPEAEETITVINVQSEDSPISFPIWKEIPDYAKPVTSEEIIQTDEMEEAVDTVSLTASTNGSPTPEDALHDGTAPLVPNGTDNRITIEHEATSNGATAIEHIESIENGLETEEELVSIEEENPLDYIDESTQLENSDSQPIKPEENSIPVTSIISKASHGVHSSESSAYVRPLFQDLPIKVSLNLQIGNNAFDCQLIHHLRVLEIRDQLSQARIDILGEVLEVRDSYGLLNIQSLDAEDDEGLSWIIEEWSLSIRLEKLGSITIVILEHVPTGKALLQLLL